MLQNLYIWVIVKWVFVILPSGCFYMFKMYYNYKKERQSQFKDLECLRGNSYRVILKR